MKRGDFWLFDKLWTVLLTPGWLFGTNPIGGWSHCAFHFVIALYEEHLLGDGWEIRH
jgi:hypothetical protein